LFLANLLGTPDNANSKSALRLLKNTDADLGRKLKDETNGSEGYLRVLISGTPERLSLRYLQGLHDAMSTFWRQRRGRKPTVFADLEASSAKKEVSVSELIELTKKCQAALSVIDCKGILIVFDEFGKFLEYESRFLGVNDVFLLQALAEHAHSGNKTKLLVLVLLHQSIEQYARGVGESLKNEWAKIQGRFEEVPFLESTEQTLRVVKAAITQKGIDGAATKRIDKSLKQSMKVLRAESVLPASLNQTEAQDLFGGLYPLHPLSAMILPQLCQLVSQNERTLFSYLGSREQNGFRAMLKQITEVGDFIRPDHIFDYFLTNQPAVNGDYLTQRRWAESVSVVDRVSGLDEIQLAVLKTVGLINLLGNRGNIRASKDVLTSVFGDATQGALESLQKSSALIHRKFNNEFRVWQGSDFDLETSVQDQINQQGPFSLAEKVTENQSLPPLVARKYSIEKGALRYFTLTFVDAITYSNVKTLMNPQIFIFLSSGQDDEQLYKMQARDELAKLGVVAYSHGGVALRNLVAERLALEVIEHSAKELNEDPVAKKEFEMRLGSIKQAELRYVNQLISNPQSSQWFYKGQALAVNSRREFQSRISAVLEQIYPFTPEIHNELINRSKPSSQAKAARNRLLGLMLTDVDKADLGIDKFPPEKGIYRAVLRETKIHQSIDGKWLLTKPPKSSSFHSAWEHMEEFFRSTEKTAMPFTETNAALISPPFGVKAGVLPILWLATYLANEDELALYEQQRYIPKFNPDTLERFVKRPDLFSVQRFRIDGIRNSMFKEYCEVFSGGATPNSILDIAKPLAVFMNQLPQYTRKTKYGLSQQAMAVREAFDLSKSPENLIFESIPKALGYRDVSVDSHSIDGFSEALKLALKELQDAHSNLVQSMADRFAECLELEKGLPISKLRERSRGRCVGLKDYTRDIGGVRGLLMRINRDVEDDKDWFEQVLVFLVTKSSSKWTDADRDEADYRLSQLSLRLTELFMVAAESRKQGSDNTDDFDVYILKSLKKGGDFQEKVVTVSKASDDFSKKLLINLEEALGAVQDDDVKLRALAQVVDRFLSRSKEKREDADITENSKQVRKKSE
jgi:hypothetical protein